MGISIKNEEVERDIRTLAELTGASVTEAVGAAVRAALEDCKRLSDQEIEKRRERLDSIVAEMQELPVFDARGHAEMLYDSEGLPK